MSIIVFIGVMVFGSDVRWKWWWSLTEVVVVDGKDGGGGGGRWLVTGGGIIYIIKQFYDKLIINKSKIN